MMLVLIFGVWLNAANIDYMKKPSHSDGGCNVYFPNETILQFNDSCDDVAKEIALQLAAKEHNTRSK